jgi:lipoprotein NlpI
LPESRPYIEQGMGYFRDGRVKESVQSFDKAILISPISKQYLWQRGISLYYSNEFQLCSEQSNTDIKLNPHDTEEILWKYMCDMNYWNNKNIISNEDTKPKLDLPISDSRKIMKLIYNLYDNTISPERVIEILATLDASNNNIDSNIFYLNLYLSLYYDSIELDKIKSIQFINQALDSNYVKFSNDYMISVAKNQKMKLI